MAEVNSSSDSFFSLLALNIWCRILFLAIYQTQYHWGQISIKKMHLKL